MTSTDRKLSRTSLSYVGLRTPDVEAMERFYTDTMGLMPEPTGEGQRGVRLGWGHGQHALELLPGPKALDHFGLEIGDAGGHVAVGERLKRLQRDGFVEGYGARLNPHLLGLGLLVFVEVMLDKTTPDVFERFAKAVQTAPEVLECHMVAGGFDYLVKARVADMTAYRRFLGESLLALPGVRETRTYAVMEEVKRDAPLPVG